MFARYCISPEFIRPVDFNFPDSKGKILFKQFPTLFWLTMDCSEIISLSLFFAGTIVC